MNHYLLKKVPFRNQFWVADGRSIKNLKELALALQDMDESTFKQHVNQHKNDFHNWVRDVHQDKKLAETLLKIKQKGRAFSAVQERVQELLKSETGLQSNYSLKNLSHKSNSLYKQPTIWIAIIGALLAVIFVSITSDTTVTGAAVGNILGRGTALLGVTFVVTGILFIVAAFHKPKLVKL